MKDLIRLSEAQMRRIEPYFPLSYGVPPVLACPPLPQQTHQRSLRRSPFGG